MLPFFKAVERNFGYLFCTKLIVLAAIFHSAPFAYAAVLALLVTLVKEVFAGILDARIVKNTMPEEGKKQLNELAARVTNIELGIQRRGF